MFVPDFWLEKLDSDDYCLLQIIHVLYLALTVDLDFKY